MTQALLAEPLASKQTRARWSSFGPARKPLKLYDWAEPGDPPCADFASVRADPIAKTIPVDSLTREVELELIRRYRQDGDIEALDWLVGAHRPMVVRMARGRWRGNGTSLAALVEYGMFGLRLAAEPPCASQTKKGELIIVSVMIISMIVGFVRWLKFDARRSKRSRRSQRSME
jgi:hypothetical protein